MSASHASRLDEGGLSKERYQRHHEEKGQGSLALTMFGSSSMVSRDSSWGVALPYLMRVLDIQKRIKGLCSAKPPQKPRWTELVHECPAVTVVPADRWYIKRAGAELAIPTPTR